MTCSRAFSSRRPRGTTALLVLCWMGTASAQVEIPETPSAAEPPRAAGVPDLQNTIIVPEDVAWGIRIGHTGNEVTRTGLKYIRVDPKNADRVFVTTWNGYIYHTVDAGRSWEEATLVVEQRPLFQSQDGYLYAGSVRDPVRGDLQFNLGSYLVGPAKPPMPTPPMIPTGANMMGISGRITGDEGFQQFGLGLSQRAPRLSALIFRKGRVSPSINLKRLTVDRGTRGHVIITTNYDPVNPRRVYAGTAYGLFETRDGGRSWFRSYMGPTPLERAVETIGFDPGNPKRMYVGTEDGLFESDDGGDTFRKNMGLAGKWIPTMVISPHDGNFLYASTREGLWRSPDRGRTWELTYFTTYPNPAWILFASEDPFNPNIGWMGTTDGVFRTTRMRTGGFKDWIRVGSQLAQHWISALYACNKHPGHVYVQARVHLPRMPGAEPTPSSSALWETLDDGKTWRTIYFGRTHGKIEWFSLDSSNNDEVWVAWTKTVERLHRRPRPQGYGQFSDNVLRQAEDLVDEYVGNYPQAPNMVNETFRRIGLDPIWLGVWREPARWAWLAPIVSLIFQQNVSNYNGSLNDIQYPTGARFLTGYEGDRFNWAILARWDLAKVIFNKDQMPFSSFRVPMLNRLELATIYYNMLLYHSELWRLTARDAVNPPKTLHAKLFSALRKQELRSLLEFYAGHRINWDMPVPPKGVPAQ